MRIRYFELSPDAFSGFLRTQEAISQGPIEKSLVQLVYQRVSLINGCAPGRTRFGALKAFPNSQEIADLTLAVAVMNAMNRVAISLRD